MFDFFGYSFQSGKDREGVFKGCCKMQNLREAVILTSHIELKSCMHYRM